MSGRAGNQITNVHYLNFDLLTIMIGIHIAAIFFYLFYKRENLITPMFSGKKTGEGLEAISGSKLGAALA